jgi:hypothetical protein
VRLICCYLFRRDFHCERVTNDTVGKPSGASPWLERC